jgi:hypothetical protein
MNDANDGHVEFGLKDVDSDGAHRIAGNDQRLHASLGEYFRATSSIANDGLF